MALPVDLYGRVFRRRPVPTIADGSAIVPARTDRVGEVFVENLYNGVQAHAVEGSYWHFAPTQTVDTGLTISVATGTTEAAAQALMVIFNGEPTDGTGRDILLDYFKIFQITVDTATTGWRIVHRLDFGNRYSSGGTALALNGPVGTQPTGFVGFVGAVTATAATTQAKNLGSDILRAGVGVARLQHYLRYGSQEFPPTVTNPATTAVVDVRAAPVVIIPPGWSYVLNEFATARSGAGTAEFYGGLICR